MFKAFLLSCVALTFALIADGAPTRQPLQPLQDDLVELQQIIKGLSEKDRETVMNIPITLPKIDPQQKKAALGCFVNELKSSVNFLGGFTDFDQVILNKIKQLLQNIDKTTTALLKNSTATNVTCPNDVEKNITEFLDAWITLCHRILNS